MSKEIEVHKLIVGTFETDLGKKLLAHLKSTIIDRPTYLQGMDLAEVAFREGQKDVILQLLKEMR